MRIYNKQNAYSSRGGFTPQITVSGKYGYINFNRVANHILGLNEGDGVELAQDDSGQWYIRKAATNGIPVTFGDTNYGKITSKVTCIDIYNTLGHSHEEVQRICIPISKEPTVIDHQGWHALITAAAVTSPANNK